MAPVTVQKSLPESFLDVLCEWGNTWMWGSLKLLGEDDWLETAIQEQTARTSGRFLMMLARADLCSSALRAGDGF
eukprot:scaffold142973_cov49-Cyclotella_meneghiniana.AAC.2